eukprot:6736284-Pyramimonas_sp.AAC.1
MPARKRRRTVQGVCPCAQEAAKPEHLTLPSFEHLAEKSGMEVEKIEVNKGHKAQMDIVTRVPVTDGRLCAMCQVPDSDTDPVFKDRPM